MDKPAKPVDLIIIDPVKIDGKHLAVGEVITGVDYELAVELVGAGRAALATEERLAAAEAAKAAAAEAAAAESKAKAKA